MSTTIIRRQTSFRLSESLIETLRKEAAKRNRSLNNFVESILMAFVSERPNKQTLAAMKEAENGENLKTLDLNDFKGFVESL